MQRIIIISHFSDLKGTTDYFIDYLVDQKISFSYLRHPLPDSGYMNSELILYDGKQVKLSKQYSSPSNFIAKTLKELLLNFRLSVKYCLQTSNVISFGAINAISPGLLRFSKLNVIFWGVDYSPTRFGKKMLDKTYFVVETIACMTSNYVVQPTKSQADARIKMHRLKPHKVIIAPNGIVPIQRMKILPRNSAIAFLYIGSLSRQHGVYEFIKQHYKTINIPIFIIGKGEDEKLIVSYKNKNPDATINLLGLKSFDDILSFINDCEYRLTGIAPYLAGAHIAYADSLKIKEYINFGLPFCASSAINISPDLRSYGVIYEDKLEISNMKFPYMSKMRYDSFVKTYSWHSIISEKVMPVIF